MVAGNNYHSIGNIGLKDLSRDYGVWNLVRIIRVSEAHTFWDSCHSDIISILCCDVFRIKLVIVIFKKIIDMRVFHVSAGANSILIYDTCFRVTWIWVL
jgi:hypothetical protein